MQLVFQEEQLFAFALHHLAYRDTRPARYHIGNVFRGHFFLDHGRIPLLVVQVLLNLLDFVFQCLQFSIADFSYLSIIAFAFGLFGFEFELFYFLLVLLDAVHQFLFALPLGLVRFLLFAEFFNLLVQDGKLCLVLFAFDGFTLNFELLQPAFYLIEFFR